MPIKYLSKPLETARPTLMDELENTPVEVSKSKSLHSKRMNRLSLRYWMLSPKMVESIKMVLNYTRRAIGFRRFVDEVEEIRDKVDKLADDFEQEGDYLDAAFDDEFKMEPYDLVQPKALEAFYDKIHKYESVQYLSSPEKEAEHFKLAQALDKYRVEVIVVRDKGLEDILKETGEDFLDMAENDEEKHQFYLDMLLDACIFFIRDPESIEWLLSIDMFPDMGINSSEWTPIMTIMELYELELDEVAKSIFLEFAKRVPASRMLVELRKNSQVQELDSEHLREVCHEMINRSDYPLITCIACAAFFQEVGRRYPTFANNYKHEHSALTEMAIQMVSDIPCDQIALMVLEDQDYESGICALDLAIETRNANFLSSARVSRILDYIWASPEILRYGGKTSIHASSMELIDALFNDPTDFFISAGFRFLLRNTIYLLFVALFTYFVLQLPSVNIIFAPRWEEIIIFSMIFLYLFDLYDLLGEVGVESFLNDTWNQLDVMIYVSFLVMFVLRVLALRGDIDGTDNSDMTMVYIILTSLNCVLLWLRAFSLFSMTYSFSPLLSMISRMMKDISKFSAIAVNIILMFTLSLHYLLKNDVDGYQTFGKSLLSVFNTSLGGFDYTDLLNLPASPRKTFAVALYTMYIFIAVITLLNMLIAMLTETYERVQQESVNEYTFTRAKMIRKLDIMDSSLPAPFNALVLPMYATWYIYYHCFKCRRGGNLVEKDVLPGDVMTLAHKKMKAAKDSDKSRDTPLTLKVQHSMYPRQVENWYCVYCQHFNNVDSYEVMEKYIFDADTSATKNCVMLVSTRDGVCEYCNRLKRTCSMENAMLNRISFVVFKYFVRYFFMAIFSPLYITDRYLEYKYGPILSRSERANATERRGIRKRKPIKFWNVSLKIRTITT